MSCNLTLHYDSAGYKQLGFLLDNWIPRANVFNVPGIVLLRSRNDNGLLCRLYDEFSSVCMSLRGLYVSLYYWYLNECLSN